MKVLAVWEPTVAATITLPAEYLGALMQLCQDRSGELTEHTHLGSDRLLLRRAATPSRTGLVIILRSFFGDSQEF